MYFSKEKILNQNCSRNLSNVISQIESKSQVHSFYLIKFDVAICKSQAESDSLKTRMCSQYTAAPSIKKLKCRHTQYKL